MGRTPCCDRAAVKRGPWSPEEDDALRAYIQRHGTGGSWITLPKKAGLRRCGKSCRLRWLNYLRPDIRHGGFTDEEDAVIISLYTQLGSKWSLIASQLQGRTDNDVKNHWNTKLKKRLGLTAVSSSATRSSPSFSPLPTTPRRAPAVPVPAPAPAHAHSTPLPSFATPIVKTETYTYNDYFLAPTVALHDPFVGAEGSTSASAASSASNWSTGDNNGTGATGADCGVFFTDFCAGSDLAAAAAADQFLGGYYYALDPTLSLV